MYGQKEVWTKIGKAAQNREKQEWAKEKPKLDNARRLRGIYLIDPGDKEYSEILKSARRKLERPVAPAMPCTRMDKQHPSIAKANAEPKIGNDKEFKTVRGCTMESHESRNSMSHYKIGAQVHSNATSDEDSGCKSCRGQGMEETRDSSSMGLGKSQEQEQGYSGSTKRQKESPLCFIDGHMPPQKCGVRTKIAEVQRQSRAQRRH